jgi:hypothetical protein
METFWTIMVYAFVLGMGAVGGLVFFYWFLVLPHRLEAERSPARNMQR